MSACDHTWTGLQIWIGNTINRQPIGDFAYCATCHTHWKLTKDEVAAAGAVMDGRSAVALAASKSDTKQEDA